MAVELSPSAALRDLERATRARRVADADASTTYALQAEAIRAALQAGCTVAEIVAISGLSQPRIYQIRDGRR